MPEITEEQLLARAKEIQAGSGKSIVDAMIQAENELGGDDDLPLTYTIELEVKPIVSKWILSTFGGSKKWPLEVRLAAYLSKHLGRARVMHKRDSEEPAEITDGGAVSVRRDQFEKAAGL
jgi:hypothetical protein